MSDELLEKLVEHDAKISRMSKDIHGINTKLDPIADAVTSIAFGFKALVALGVASGAVMAILSLKDYFG